jgi:hypothetical protein
MAGHDPQQQWLDDQFEAAYPKARPLAAHYHDSTTDIEGAVVFRGRPAYACGVPQGAEAKKSWGERLLETVLFIAVVVAGVGLQAFVFCSLTHCGRFFTAVTTTPHAATPSHLSVTP